MTRLWLLATRTMPMKARLQILRCLAGFLLGLWGTSGVALVLGQPTLLPPDVLAFQGRLVDPTGQPLGSTNAVNYVAVFRVWDNLVGGGLLWTEQQTMTVRDGRFAVMLGEGSMHGPESRPPLASVFGTSNASDRFLEVTVKGPGTQDGWLTVAPRTRLVAGAYSLLSTRARSARNIVGSDRQPRVSASGSNVGINKANPTVPLDVAGSMASSGLVVSGNVTVQGNAEAGGLNGLGMAPVGTILMWTGAQPPPGWVLCDGSVVAGVRTPDLRGRFVMSPDIGYTAVLPQEVVGSLFASFAGSPNVPWTTAGRETYSHQTSELPSHRHSSVRLRGRTGSDADGPHEYRVAAIDNKASPQDRGLRAANNQLGTVTTSEAGGHGHSFTLPSFVSGVAGSGAPRNVMPPFYVLAFIMRVQ